MRRSFCGLAVASAMAVVTACGGGGGSGSSDAAGGSEDGCSNDITVIEGGAQVFRLPVYVAMGRGMFSDEGLNVTLTEADSGSQTAQIVAGGRAEFGLGQLVDLVNLYKNDVSAKAIGMLTDQISNSIVVRADLAEDLSADAMAEYSIGITGVGSGTWQFAQYVAKTIGVDSSQLRFVEVGENGVNSIKSGRIDMFSFADPHNLALVQDGDAEWFVDTEDVSNGITPDYPELEELSTQPYLNNLIYSTSSYLEECPDVARRVHDSLRSAAAWIEENSPEEITEVTQEYELFQTQDEELLKASIDRLITSGAVADSVTIDEEAYSNAMEYLTSVGEEYDPVPYEELVQTPVQK